MELRTYQTNVPSGSETNRFINPVDKGKTRMFWLGGGTHQSGRRNKTNVDRGESTEKKNLKHTIKRKRGNPPYIFRAWRDRPRKEATRGGIAKAWGQEPKTVPKKRDFKKVTGRKGN